VQCYACKATPIDALDGPPVGANAVAVASRRRACIAARRSLFDVGGGPDNLRQVGGKGRRSFGSYGRREPDESIGPFVRSPARRTARLALAIVSALAAFIQVAAPAHAQWNLYGNGGSFFVPITTAPNGNGGPPQYLVSLTLKGYSQSSNFILDTGSLGLVASPGYYTPGNDTVLAPYATITYSTSGANPVGALYLTNVQINGANGQSVIARVPILGAATTASTRWASASTVAV